MTRSNDMKCNFQIQTNGRGRIKIERRHEERKTCCSHMSGLANDITVILCTII